jgi:hypothetical protein
MAHASNLFPAQEHTGLITIDCFLCGKEFSMLSTTGEKAFPFAGQTARGYQVNRSSAAWIGRKKINSGSEGLFDH